jgi:hypothetical protein
MTVRVLVAALALGLPGCAPEQGTEVATEHSAEDYRAWIHPILEARCGTLDCHGDPGRPLRLFSETGLRRTDELRGLPLADAEVEANLRAISAIEFQLLVEKPLAGGLAHEGGDVWLDLDGAQPRCYLSWLERQEPDPATCDDALLEVMLP